MRACGSLSSGPSLRSGLPSQACGQGDPRPQGIRRSRVRAPGDGFRHILGLFRLILGLFRLILSLFRLILSLFRLILSLSKDEAKPQARPSTGSG